MLGVVLVSGAVFLAGCNQADESKGVIIVKSVATIRDVDFARVPWKLPLGATETERETAGSAAQAVQYVDIDGDGSTDALVELGWGGGKTRFTYAWLWREGTARQVRPAIGVAAHCADIMRSAVPHHDGTITVSISPMVAGQPCAAAGTATPFETTVRIDGLWAWQVKPTSSALGCPRVEHGDVRKAGAPREAGPIRAYPDGTAPVVAEPKNLFRYGDAPDQYDVPPGWKRVVFVPVNLPGTSERLPCGFMRTDAKAVG